MERDSPWSPLAVMLSMYGSRISSKLLFKYPFESSKYSQTSLRSYKQLTSSTYHLNQPLNKGNSLSLEDEMDNDIIRDEIEQYLGFCDDTLAQISCPGNSKICGQKFDVKINGLRFVGFPLMLDHSNIESESLHLGAFLSNSDVETRCKGIITNDGSDIIITSFNVVFVLKTTADYSVVETYQQLAAKLGIGLRFEEKRDCYMTKQTRAMLNIHDEETDMTGEEIYRKILEKSSLAQNLRCVFDSLEETGIISLSLNNNLCMSFCLYHKVHNSCFFTEKFEPVNIVTIEKCLNKIQPFHGLLVYDIKDVWASLTDYCSMSIIKFLNVYNPIKSLQALSIDADIAINHVYTIARHLVLWGKACIIYPLCESNVYVLAPTATLSYQSKLLKVFGDRFQLNLTDVLAYFSSPISLGDFQSPTGPFFGNENKLVEILIWMLQHRFLVQHHTYLYFLPPSTTSTCEEDGALIKKKLLDMYESTCPELLRLEQLPQVCKSVLSAIPAAHLPEDLTLFLKLLKYFDGAHHLEEIMYRENLVRLELYNIIDKFKPVLLTCVREDEIASAFCLSQ